MADIKEEHRILTMDDVARELGISKTTVSRALSGKGRISPETVKKVQEYAAQHNFKPNAIAKGLSQNKTFNLALTLPPDFGETEVSFFKECVGGICREAMEYDYDVVIAMLNRQMVRMLNNRKVDGVIMTRVLKDDPMLKEALRHHLPVVVLGSGEENGVIYVDNDNFSGSREITDMLLKKGRRPGIIGGDSDRLVTKARLNGCLKAYEDNGLEIAPPNVILDVSDHISMADAIDRVRASGADTLVCMDDNICIMAMDVLHEKNIKVPDEMSVVSLYDSKNLEKMMPSVTSLHFETRQLGKIAVRHMMTALGVPAEAEKDVPGHTMIQRGSVKG